MSEAIYSARYAAALVNVSRNGATFEPNCWPHRVDEPGDHDCMRAMEGVPDAEWEEVFRAKASVPHPSHCWEPASPIVGNSWEDSYDARKEVGAYWVAWWRETEAAKLLARACMNDRGNPDRQQWHEAHTDLRRLMRSVRKSLDALAGWCAS